MSVVDPKYTFLSKGNFMFVKYKDVNYFVSPKDKNISDLVTEIWLRSNEKLLSPEKKRQITNEIMKQINESKINF